MSFRIEAFRADPGFDLAERHRHVRFVIASYRRHSISGRIVTDQAEAPGVVATELWIPKLFWSPCITRRAVHEGVGAAIGMAIGLNITNRWMVY